MEGRAASRRLFVGASQTLEVMAATDFGGLRSPAAAVSPGILPCEDRGRGRGGAHDLVVRGEVVYITAQNADRLGTIQVQGL